MNRHKSWVVAGCLAFLGATAVAAQDVAIGLVPSLIEDLSPGKQKFVRGELPILVNEFTGLTGTLVEGKDAHEVADKTAAGKNQFAVFQGVEFAWVRDKHPELKTLMVAIYHKPHFQAAVVVKKDSGIESFDALKGKTLGWFKQGEQHVRLHLRKATGGDPVKFFGKITMPENAEASLDAVLLGKVQAAVVDQVALDIYKDVSPGKYNRLKVISQSPEFPPTAIAYAPGKVPEDVVSRFRAGMLKANQTARGRDVMSSFRITAFLPVPADYEGQLAKIGKDYPEPK